MDTLVHRSISRLLAFLHEKFDLRFLAIGMGVLLVFFLTRSTGIHCDEANYVQYSYTNGSGDSKGSGKPPLFYFVNLLIMNSWGFLIFPWRPLALHFFYGGFNVLGLCFLAKKLPLTPARRWLFFSLVLLSPFFLFNSTQVMMETPIVGLMLLAFGALEIAAQGAEKRFSRWGMLALFFAFLLKETSFFAILILFLGYAASLRSRIRPLLGTLFVAIVVRAALNWVLGIGSNSYSQLDNVFSLAAIRDKFTGFFAYSEMWLFYLWPPLLLALMILARKNRRGFLLVGLSYAATLFIQVVSGFDFARYCYPVVTLGVAALALGVARSIYLPVGWILSLSLLIPSYFMTSLSGGDLKHWPRLVTTDAYYNALNSFAGIPILGWFALSGWRSHQLCVWAGRDPQSNQGFLIRNVDNFHRRALYFKDGEWEKFLSCPGTRLVARIDYQNTPDCSPVCEKTDYRLTTCRAHPAGSVFWVNRSCLP